MSKPPKTRPDRQDLEFALALGAIAAAVALAFLYAWLTHGVSKGWLNNFGRAAATNLVAVAIIYVLAYVVLLRRGLRREDDIASRVVEALDARDSARPAGLLGFYGHPGAIDWGPLLAGVNDLVAAGRWFSAWSNENFTEIKAFFAGGGRARVYVLAPDNTKAVAAAARQHAGFTGAGDVTSAIHKIQTTVNRLRSAAEASPHGSQALQLRYVRQSDVVVTQSLFRLRGDGLDRLVLYASDNFRADRHRSPAVIVDLNASEELREFVETELAGFNRVSIDAPA